MQSLGFSIYRIISSSKNHNLRSSFPKCTSFPLSLKLLLKSLLYLIRVMVPGTWYLLPVGLNIGCKVRMFYSKALILIFLLTFGPDDQYVGENWVSNSRTIVLLGPASLFTSFSVYLTIDCSNIRYTEIYNHWNFLIYLYIVISPMKIAVFAPLLLFLLVLFSSLFFSIFVYPY